MAKFDFIFFIKSLNLTYNCKYSLKHTCTVLFLEDKTVSTKAHLNHFLFTNSVSSCPLSVHRLTFRLHCACVSFYLYFTCGLAFATSRSCRVTSCTISFFLWTSPLGSGTYSSASRSNSVANVSDLPWRWDQKVHYKSLKVKTNLCEIHVPVQESYKTVTFLLLITYK